MQFKITSGIVFLIIFLQSAVAQAITYPDEVSTKAEADFVVGIYLNENPGQFTASRPMCTGVLYQKQVVITAAHCVDGYTAEQILVSSPGDKVSQAGLYQSMGIVKHERFSRSKSKIGLNDIALLVLDLPIEKARLVEIADRKSLDLLIKSKMYIYGYGLDQNGESPDEVRRSLVFDYSKSAGKQYNSFNSSIHLAVGKYNKKERVYSRACSGDSGGPLISFVNNKAVLLGITSFGAEDCNAKIPSVYMKVSAYNSWIKSALNRLGEFEYNGIYRFNAMDLKGDAKNSLGGRVGGDILFSEGMTSRVDQRLYLKTVMQRNYSDTSIDAGLRIDFDEDGVWDLVEDLDSPAMLDGSGVVVCSFDKLISESSVEWELGKACFAKRYSNWMSLYVDSLEYIDQGGVLFEARDSIFLTGLYIATDTLIKR
jgi:hypothetical protein